MRHCQHCNATIKGEWEQCPLCQTTLDEGTDPVLPDPYPKIPLRFNKEIVTKYLTLISFVLIIAFLLIELIWIGRMENLQLALFGIISMWLSVLILIRKRRNIAKGIVYLIVSLVASVHLFGLSLRVERLVNHLCCADHLQFCDRILIHRGAPRQIGRQGLRVVPFDSRLAGAFAGAVPDFGLGHDVIAFKPVGHDERRHFGHHPALSRRRDMARAGEKDACLKSDVAKISEIKLYLAKQKSFEKFEFSKLFICLIIRK